jgi:hypothetical protein
MAGFSIFGQGGPSTTGGSPFGAQDPGIFSPGHDPGSTTQPNGTAQPSNLAARKKKRPFLQSVMQNNPQAAQAMQMKQMAMLGGTSYADSMEQMMMNPSNAFF